MTSPLLGLLIGLGVAAWAAQKGEGGGAAGGGHESEVQLQLAPAAFRAFRDNYILVYATAMAGDWLQGPYIYCLYEFYGYGVGPIGKLFIAGFGSSMLFGTLAGVLADKYGRRRACLAYCVTYIASCLTKHSPSFAVLLVGRLLGGVATSLLFSSFEAWLVAEHTRRGFDEALLGHVFARASYVGAGLMAIMAGLLGDVLVEKLGLGPVAPFDAAVVVLVLTAAIVAASWPENFGGQSHDGVVDRLGAAVVTICSDRRIFLLGALQAMYEGVLYTFVFLWTPSLSSQGEKVPHGMVFSCFMAASMVGSALAGRLLAHMRPQQYMAWVYLASLASMAVPFAINCLPGRRHHYASHASSAPPPRASLREDTLPVAPEQGLGLTGYAQVLAFCVFELCLGIFWPSMMTLRAQLVPEATRSTIINCFRIPLNLFVCVALFEVSHRSLASMFGLCMALLAACAACQLWLNAELWARPSTTPKVPHSHS